ncbi:MAG: O-antigen ligase family protein [Noviherbaspirillum sp.]
MTSVDYHKPSGKLQRATELAFCAVFFFLPISKPMLFLSLALALGLFIAGGRFAAAWQARRIQPWMVPAVILSVLPFLSLALHKDFKQGIESLDLGYYWMVAALTFFAASSYAILPWMRAFAGGIFVVFCFERMTVAGWLPAVTVAPAAMGNYILYSQFLAVGFVLLSILYRNDPRRSVRGIYLAAMLLFFFGLTSGKGRSGMLVVLVLLPFVFSNIFFRQSRKRIFLGCMIALLALLISPKVQDRIEVAATDVQMFRQGITQTSLGYRFDMWNTALDVVRAHPLAGAGTSGFRDAWRSAPRSGQGLEFIEPHNAFLFFATSYGIVGLLALIWLYAAMLWTGWTQRHSLEGSIVFAFAVICIVGSMTNTMFMGAVSHLWMMLFVGLQGSLLPARSPSLSPETHRKAAAQ